MEGEPTQSTYYSEDAGIVDVPVIRLASGSPVSMVARHGERSDGVTAQCTMVVTSSA
jgi:hypothetical protein